MTIRTPQLKPKWELEKIIALILFIVRKNENNELSIQLKIRKEYETNLQKTRNL